jgi:hypothetical protein
MVEGNTRGLLLGLWAVWVAKITVITFYYSFFAALSSWFQSGQHPLENVRQLATPYLSYNAMLFYRWVESERVPCISFCRPTPSGVRTYQLPGYRIDFWGPYRPHHLPNRYVYPIGSLLFSPGYFGYPRTTSS